MHHMIWWVGMVCIYCFGSSVLMARPQLGCRCRPSLVPSRLIMMIIVIAVVVGRASLVGVDGNRLAGFPCVAWCMMHVCVGGCGISVC